MVEEECVASLPCLNDSILLESFPSDVRTLSLEDRAATRTDSNGSVELDCEKYGRLDGVQRLKLHLDLRFIVFIHKFISLFGWLTKDVRKVTVIQK